MSRLTNQHLGHTAQGSGEEILEGIAGAGSGLLRLAEDFVDNDRGTHDDGWVVMRR